MTEHHYSNRPLQPDNRLHGAIVACQNKQGLWLVIRRAYNLKAAPGMIGFPGGGVEVGETYEDAAMREFREEIGVEVSLVEQVWEYAFEDKPLTLFGYYGKIENKNFEPDPHEVDACLWMEAEQVRSHPDALPKSGLFMDALENFLADSN